MFDLVVFISRNKELVFAGLRRGRLGFYVFAAAAARAAHFLGRQAPAAIPAADQSPAIPQPAISLPPYTEVGDGW